ncbi:MAG: TIGR04348 family glycosyltransferase [Planctomycetes bacterium]|nr:TIGR04348 family glycosyltransferase [Planctomycetota bacterium]
MPDVLIVTPVAPDSLTGNGITARRWAGILERLGSRTTIGERYDGQPCEMLVALHAQRSASSVAKFKEDHPDRPLLVALTGTDLYGDLAQDKDVCSSLEQASHLIVLQARGPDALPEHLRPKARVIYQSASAPPNLEGPPESGFDVCVLGHLRPVKAPFLAEAAARLLPASSQVRILHLGAALDDESAAAARAKESENPRYHWHGTLPHPDAMRFLARCHLHVLTSEMEGAANAISEAMTLAVPTVATRIAGCVGMLGADYPGLFPVGDAEALASLMHRAETDAAFYALLRSRCRERAHLVDPDREFEAWEALLNEIRSRNGRESG